MANKCGTRDICCRNRRCPKGAPDLVTGTSTMTSIMPARSGIDPAHSAGQIRLGRGERETRGEHRGRGERLPSGSRFVFLVVLLPLLLFSGPLGAQERPTGFSIGLRISGVAGTNLIEDAIGQ